MQSLLPELLSLTCTKNLSQVVKDLYEYGQFLLRCLLLSFFHVSSTVNPKNGRPASMISKEIYEIVRDNAEALDSALIYNRDFNYNS